MPPLSAISSSENPASLGTYKTNLRIFSYEIGRRYRIVYSIRYRENIVELLRVCDHKSVYGKDWSFFLWPSLLTPTPVLATYNVAWLGRQDVRGQSSKKIEEEKINNELQNSFKMISLSRNQLQKKSITQNGGDFMEEQENIIISTENNVEERPEWAWINWRKEN